MKICKIEIKASSKHKPPPFMGLELRNSFGLALKSVSCINRTYKCSGCFAATNCLYYKLYEQKNEYKKFRFDFLLNQEKYDFNLYIFDEICDDLPYIVSALQIMLDRMNRYFQIFINGVSCKKDGVIKLPSKTNFTLDFSGYAKDLSVKFLTPLRIKKDGVFSKNIDINDILNSILKRKADIFGINDKFLKIPNSKAELNFKILNVRNNALRLGGFLGQMSLNGLSFENFSLLRLGEIIGVGKQCVYGLGKIKMECKSE